jgi:hypothetical protein
MISMAMFHYLKCTCLYYRLERPIQPQPKAVNSGSRASPQISSSEQN